MGNKPSTKKQTRDNLNLSDNSFDLYAFPFENIVFAGGSNYLLEYVGAVRCLEEAGIWSRVIRLAGSGTGALLAALLSVGYSSTEVETALNINIQTLTQDRTCAGCCLGCSMTSSYGWHPNNKVIKWLGARIKEATGSERATFNQIYKKFNRELCVVVTNISEGCAEYCHPKTTPNLPVIDAVRMTLATPGLCSPVKYRLNHSNQLFADGGIFYNFPVHCFDGWWLSLQRDDNFLSQHGVLHEQTKLTVGDQTRFIKYNAKTLGFIVFNEFSSDSFTRQLIERGSQQKVVVPSNQLAKKWDKRKQEVEITLESYVTFTAAANNFIAAFDEVFCDMNKKLTKNDVEDFLKKSKLLSPADLKTLFENKQSADDIWSTVKPSSVAQPSVRDIHDYLQHTSFRLYRRCRERCTTSDVTGLADYWQCLQQACHQANSRQLVGKDVERTIGIDIRYLGGLHNKQLTKQDRVFLIEQGRQAAKVFLEQFVRTSPPPIREAPDRRSYCRDDLHNFIDDDVSEIIDELDYMESSVTRHR